MMALLDFSVDALVFPDRAENRVLHTNGLTEQQIEALSRLIDTMKTKPAGLRDFSQTAGLFHTRLPQMYPLRVVGWTDTTASVSCQQV